MTTTRVVLVDDDPDILLGVKTALELDGYDVTTARDGSEGLLAIADADPAAVVLDLTMPRMDGLAVLRTLRAMGDRVPILILTARDNPADRVAGLDAGADDYLGKPFDLDELLARVRALVRRSTPSEPGGLSVGALHLDEEVRLLAAPGGRVQLTRIETALVRSFFLDPGRVRSRDELIAAVWGDDEPPRSNALDVYISQLRRKLDSVGEPGLVVTIRGLGYRLAEP